MPADLREFWSRFQSGVEVAVDGVSPDRSLGVRDGFLRYFHDGLERPVPVAVVAQEIERPPLRGVAPSNEEAIERARERAHHLRERLRETYHFYVSSEAGVEPLEVGGTLHHFVRTWTVVVGVVGEAWGSSGAVELPPGVVAGTDLDQPGAAPGTRRSGGLVSSLTGGLETRRRAVALGTLHALASFFHGLLEPRALRHR
jgi:non-canonical (house-cleaning) NTP pyrophosphatase